MREIGPSGSMSGSWKRSMAADIRAPATERAGNKPSRRLHNRATSRVYTIGLSTAASLSKPAAELIEIALDPVIRRDAARERR
jgi:hypothetical protein